MGYWTAQQVLSLASNLLGLGEQSAPFASVDANVVQLRGLLNAAGKALCREREWAHLRVQYSFTTTAGLDTYSMPGDFERWVNQTQWNRSSRLPLGGPVTPQGWQMLKTLNMSAAVQMFFRTEGPNLLVHPVPAGVYTLALEYMSGWWVQADGSSSPSGDTNTDPLDTLLFEPMMLVQRIRRDFLDAKGFDSSAASNAYEAAYAAAAGQDEAAPILNLNHSPYNRARLLDGSNVPPTGFGMS